MAAICRPTKPWVHICALLAIICLAASCAPPEATQQMIGSRVTPVWLSSDEMDRSLPIHLGIAQSIVDLGGAAWYEDSAALGEGGTTVLFGHRVSHGEPFRTLDRLRPGSTIDLRGSDGHTYTYTVVGTRITRPAWDAVLAFQPASGKGLTLVACHPMGSTSQRIVVDAELSGVA